MATYTPASGAHTDNGTPHGFTSLTPFHTVRNAAAALTFYQDVFGATVIDITEMPDGNGGTLVGQATLDFGQGRLQIADVMPGFGLIAPAEDDAVSSSIVLYVPNVDDVVDRAVESGATLREAVQDFVSGDRFGSIRDPFGIRWAIVTRIVDLTDAESAQRVRDWAAAQI